MSKLQHLYPRLEGRVLGPGPRTALSTNTHSSTGRRTGGGPRHLWIHTDRVHPVTSHPTRRLNTEQVKPLIRGRLADIESAFIVVDPDGTGLVGKEEFVRVLESVLRVGQNQLDTVINKVWERSGGTVDYMQFLRSFRRAPVDHRACSSHSGARRGPQNTSMSLSDIQKHLKDKIGGNLRTVIRVFRLFDYDQQGHIQQQEFRRILDNYCTHLTNKEFQRLWNHYSPKNESTISYQLFLEKLGLSDSQNFKIAPVSTKLEVPGRGTTPPMKVEQRPASHSCSCDVPSVLPHRKLQSLFHEKMCMNSTPVWQALQAFDTTHSGLVKQDVLRDVLSSFIFPMNRQTFQKLSSRYGVGATGPVRWKSFLSNFMSHLKEEGSINLQSNRAFVQPAPEEDNMHLQDIFHRLKGISHLLETKTGRITRADLRHLLEGRGGRHPRTPRACFRWSQITELLNSLDPEHTGVIQLADLQRLIPAITSAPTGDAAPQPSSELLDVPEKNEDAAEEQKTPDERQTTQCADKVSVTSASWRAVENLLLDKLCEQRGAALAALKMCDPRHTGYVTREDLKKVLSCYGMPISDTHFKELCKTSSSRPGNSSKLVHYPGFLRNLGVPLEDETHTPSMHKKHCYTERPRTSPQWRPRSVRGQRPPTSLQHRQDSCNILDIIFQRMRLSFEERHTGLNDQIQTVTHNSEGTLSETDVRKILEDSWVMLDDKNFDKFTELLGFMDGRIERSAFLAKYEEAAARDRQQASEGHGDKDEVEPLLTSAEQCLAALKTRIKTVHGDNLTAFRLMDRKCKGVVDCHDFKGLYNSLRFFCREEEYHRLLHLIGLHPGRNLNYAEFVDVVENDGKHKLGTQPANVQGQIRELLACEARSKWADMSKVLCQFDTDGHGWIHKKSLRRLLFTYSLPLRSDEFDQLWSRYDPEGRSCVKVCDFLEKLGFHHEGELMPRSKKLNQTVAQQNADRPVSDDAASLACIQQILQNYEGLSDTLTPMETRRDRVVTAEQLLSLLHTNSCPVKRERLVNHQHRLSVSTDEYCKKPAYMDSLSMFEHKAEKKNEPPPASPDVVHQIGSLESLSPRLALSRMQELVTASAPHLYKAFLAFDRSRTGTVNALEFRQVLDNFCSRMSDKQHRYMLTKLELDCENSTVNWKDFLNKFQSPSTLTNLETTEHLQQIQEVVSGHLYEITKELMDLDPSSSATVSKDQFRQLCDRHCLRLTNDQFECVWSQMPVNEQKLQYREFLKRFGAVGKTPHTEAGGSTNNIPSSSPKPIETSSRKKSLKKIGGATLQRTKSAPQWTSRRPASVGRQGTGSLVGSMERRLRGAVQHCWKDILRNCTEEDSQQEGHISITSFLEILQSVSIKLTQEQFEHVAVKMDIMNNGCVSYHNFLRHLLLNLKPADAKRPFERCKLPLPTTSTSRAVPGKNCVEVMLRINHVVCSSWASIRRCFLKHDYTRAGIVSVQDFRKVLRHFSINLSSEEFFHLSSHFDANTAGRICYNDFLWVFLH